MINGPMAKSLNTQASNWQTIQVTKLENQQNAKCQSCKVAMRVSG